MHRLIIIALVAASVKAQLDLEGACELTTINAVRELNATQFSGEWYQIARIANAETGACATTTFVSVVEDDIFVSGIAETRQVVNKTVVWWNATITPSERGVYIFNYSNEVLDTVVLDTDYTGYALLYSCQQNTTHKKVWAWQLGRANAFNENQTTAINSALELNNDFRNVSWLSVGHSAQDCETTSDATLVSPILATLALCSVLTKLI